MSLVLVAGQALLEEKIRGQGVEVVLKVVVVFEHGLPHTFRPVVCRITSQPVRFPVNQVVAILEAEEQIDEAMHESLDRIEAKASHSRANVAGQSGASIDRPGETRRRQVSDRVGELYLRKP